MATYEYRCPRDGDFEVRFPIGAAAARVTCSACGADAARVFSAPLLTRTPQSLAAAIDRTERSAETPEVVTSVPPRPRPARRRQASPALARLPRP
ncbi:zinc ribbon domain-containing protein [Planosporangium thailandense]|uniref:Zinc ribbon domain-containing protein n=1 Tax=Planosporangium thailandense TaxID=765197 RepID=A0ABX0Y517_9ACTN|nr:zinc ribbon domain-containing protein [Planosporangium thailandense]NJC73128.1 zinc ribbon domain-containing protein [Planosporangium thailandense]